MVQMRGRRWWWLLRFAGEDDWLLFYFDPRQKWNSMASGEKPKKEVCYFFFKAYEGVCIKKPRQGCEEEGMVVEGVGVKVGHFHGADCCSARSMLVLDILMWLSTRQNAFCC
ncbi:hypothetical protein DEO72_LG2g3807 [Vigna unguiculata]|uniref:Uncharacterized protein n=1 Tax=Vigna unguiculata TaxID=3917 RepID=A0A4D6L4M6_VIGUN|nr:hypothetical protein DEO72_LG2g3807 [Vigna unguiculata]